MQERLCLTVSDYDVVGHESHLSMYISPICVALSIPAPPAPPPETVCLSWRRYLNGLLLGCAHSEVIGKGKSHVGKMDAIRADPHLDTRIKICILINVIVRNL